MRRRPRGCGRDGGQEGAGARLSGWAPRPASSLCTLGRQKGADMHTFSRVWGEHYQPPNRLQHSSGLSFVYTYLKLKISITLVIHEYVVLSKTVSDRLEFWFFLVEKAIYVSSNDLFQAINKNRHVDFSKKKWSKKKNPFNYIHPTEIQAYQMQQWRHSERWAVYRNPICHPPQTRFSSLFSWYNHALLPLCRGTFFQKKNYWLEFSVSAGFSIALGKIK